MLVYEPSLFRIEISFLNIFVILNESVPSQTLSEFYQNDLGRKFSYTRNTISHLQTKRYNIFTFSDGRTLDEFLMGIEFTLIEFVLPGIYVFLFFKAI
jgi:hypothetical protein